MVANTLASNALAATRAEVRAGGFITRLPLPASVANAFSIDALAVTRTVIWTQAPLTGVTAISSIADTAALVAQAMEVAELVRARVLATVLQLPSDITLTEAPRRVERRGSMAGAVIRTSVDVAGRTGPTRVADTLSSITLSIAVTAARASISVTSSPLPSHITDTRATNTGTVATAALSVDLAWANVDGAVVSSEAYLTGTLALLTRAPGTVAVTRAGVFGTGRTLPKFVAIAYSFNAFSVPTAVVRASINVTGSA